MTCLYYTIDRRPSIELIDLLLEKGMDANETHHNLSCIKNSRTIKIFFLLLLHNAEIDDSSFDNKPEFLNLIEDLKNHQLWKIERHKLFPLKFKSIVFLMLLVHRFYFKAYFSKHLLFVIFNFTAFSTYQIKI